MSKNEINEKVSIDKALDIVFTNSEFLSVIKEKMTVENLFKTYEIKQDTDKNVGVIKFGLECKNLCLIDPSFSVKVDFVSKNVLEIRESAGLILFPKDKKIVE
ncbi:hypothetical protein COL35_29210 [Bacillus toyonensis]|uniref:hypothetical protein n=1 Tax=Bacillus toyonensis TaxID=155322 RepID=UPI000BF9FE58|nr:hypothetical protein [Bacillus toyonensis]PFX63069.1 hypothetical protein COL35_29210 [Bacillus toyonensis]